MPRLRPLLRSLGIFSCMEAVDAHLSHAIGPFVCQLCIEKMTTIPLEKRTQWETYFVAFPLIGQIPLAETLTSIQHIR